MKSRTAMSRIGRSSGVRSLAERANATMMMDEPMNERRATDHETGRGGPDEGCVCVCVCVCQICGERRSRKEDRVVTPRQLHIGSCIGTVRQQTPSFASSMFLPPYCTIVVVVIKVGPVDDQWEAWHGVVARKCTGHTGGAPREDSRAHCRALTPWIPLAP